SDVGCWLALAAWQDFVEAAKPCTLVTMKSLAFALAIGLLFFGCASPAHGDEASKSAKIEEMMKITHVDQMTTKMIEQMKPLIQKSMNVSQDMLSSFSPEMIKMTEELARKYKK